jgi:DNA-binding PadR family transcriptional regulator
MRGVLGINEALILTALTDGGSATVADIATRLENCDLGRRIDDGSIYVALQRMAERGFIRMRKTRVVSGDGRPRDVGIYRITGSGCDAVEQFSREARALTSLRAEGAPA